MRNPGTTTESSPRSPQLERARAQRRGPNAAKNKINILKKKKKRSVYHDFPGCTVVKTSLSNAGGADSIPGRGAKIPHASRTKNQNIKQKQYCNKFNKDFKNGPHQKNLKKKKEVFIVSGHGNL